VIFRKIDGGKLISVGGVTMSATFRECLLLLTKAPDHARFGVLQDGLFSGVEAREGQNGVIYTKITVQALEKVVTSSGAV
jgi:hypothetical protein